MKHLCVAAGLTALACGCDPGWKIEGTVVDLRGAPVAGAEVELACPPNGPNGYKAKTSADGRFDFGGVAGAFGAAACSVSIAKAGFATKTVKATEVCHRSTETKNYTVPCDPKASTITLAP